jgi:hypothetical protein
MAMRQGHRMRPSIVLTDLRRPNHLAHTHPNATSVSSLRRTGMLASRQISSVSMSTSKQPHYTTPAGKARLPGYR